MKTKGVKETFKDIHHEQYTKRDTCKNSKTNVGREEVNVQSRKHSLFPKHSGKLGMGERKGPETKVRGSVGNHTENKLNSLDSLMNDNLAKAVFFMTTVVATVVLFVFTVVFNRLMSLPREKVWLGKEKDRYRTKRNEEKNILNISLTVVNGLVDVSRLESNVDKGSNEVGRLATVTAATVVEGALGSSIIVPSA